MSRTPVRRMRVASVAVILAAALQLAGGARVAGAAPVQQTLIENGLHRPIGVAVDGAGTTYVADSYNNRVLALPKGGPQITLPITITNPSAIAVDAGGTVYVVETNGARVVKLPPGGTASNLPITGLDPQYGIYGVAVDTHGNVFVADTGHNRVIKLTSGGTQTTLPLNLSLPFGVAVDAGGNVYASQAYGGAVVKLAPNGTQTTVPFSGLQGPWGMAVNAVGDVFVVDFRTGLTLERTVGGVQQTLPFTGLFEPKGITVDAGGTVYVADYNSRILAWTPGGAVTTVGFTGLSGPTGVAVDTHGATYIADDFKNGRVQRRAADGTVTDLGFTGLSGPGGVAVDAAGSVYVASWNTSTITKRTTGGIQTVLPFSGLRQPGGVAVDSTGAVYVTDTGHARLVKLSASGAQSTLSTGLNAVSGVAVDLHDNVYVSGDLGRVVQLTPAGAQSTLGFTGIAAAGSVAVDPSGNVFVIDYPNHRVAELPKGGTPFFLPFTDIFEPWGLAADAAGNVFVTASAPSGGLVELPSGAPNAPLNITAEPGDGAATVSWQAPYANGGPITGYVVTPVRNGVAQAPQVFASPALSQQIVGLDNGEAYTFAVAATNGIGTGPTGTSTTPITIGVPSRASFLAADPGDTTATLTWWPSQSNAAPILGYTITPVVNGVALAPVLTVGPATAHTLTGLVNGTHYRFEVTARNSVGTSAVAATTATVGTPSRPWVFLRTQPGITSATLSWWAPPANAAPITGYTITPYIGWVAQAPRSFASPATTQTITGLTTGVRYSFKVTPHNALGAGGIGNTNKVIIGAPTAPTDVQASAAGGGVTVRWASPQANAAPITSYRVIRYIGWWVPQSSTTVAAPATETTLTGLVPGVTYTFHVIASNALGEGPLSHSSPSVTL